MSICTARQDVYTRYGVIRQAQLAYLRGLLDSYTPQSMAMLQCRLWALGMYWRHQLIRSLLKELEAAHKCELVPGRGYRLLEV
jgi:hypothetical protein